MDARIESHVASALAALNDVPFRDGRGRDLLSLLARVQASRVA
jgi:hypothetical protein